MELGHLMVIWVANGVLPIGVFLLFLVDHVIQWLMKWRSEGVI